MVIEMLTVSKLQTEIAFTLRCALDAGAARISTSVVPFVLLTCTPDVVAEEVIST
jgi:hypothetical protein